MTALALALGLAGAGCSPMNRMPKKFAWFSPKDDQPQVPAKIVAVWTDTVQYKPNATPTRGFGGRLMFYGAPADEADEVEKPVKVEGTLVVYAFDEKGRGLADNKPDHKYVFPADQFTRLYSTSRLGHSYSVWLPWDEVGGEQKEVSLIVRFTAQQGPTIVGEQTKHILPGQPAEPVQAKASRPMSDWAVDSPISSDRRGIGDSSSPGVRGIGDNNSPLSPGGRGVGGEGVGVAGQVQPVSYDAAAASSSEPEQAGRMATTTIQLPSRFGRGMPAPSLQPGAVETQGLAPAPTGPMTSPAATESSWTNPAAAQGSQAQPVLSRFSRARLRPLGEPIARLERDHGSWQRRPAMWQSPPEPSPGPAPETESP